MPLNTLEDTWVKLNLIDGTANLNEFPVNVRMSSWCNMVLSEQVCTVAFF